MVFLSELQRRQVIDSDGRALGRVADVVVQPGDAFPTVSAVVFEGPAGRWIAPWDAVADFEGPAVRLHSAPPHLPDTGVDHEVRLSRDVLDRQIVDTKGRRVVKVNDLKLTTVRGQARLLGADVSVRAYLRRLGLDGLVAASHLPMRERLITWNYVNDISPEGSDVQLNVSRQGLAKLHPADIAELLDQLDADEGAALLGKLEDPVAAVALTELDSDLQEDLLERIGAERAADLLEIMPADDAADILGDLPAEQAASYLAGMEPSEAAELRDLLRYDEESAGGIMTPEVIALPHQMTVQGAINRLRSVAAMAQVAYYLFVIDDAHRLVGVVSLRDLVTHAPATRLRDIMQQQVHKIGVKADQEEAARIISKYDLLALPVVDEEDKLVGVITVDDIIDVIQNEADEDLSAVAGASIADIEGSSGIVESAVSRFRWLAVGLIGGLVAAAVLRAFGGDDAAATVVAFGPLLVLLAGQTVSQSLAVVTRGLGLGLAGDIPGRELRIGLLLATTVGLAAGGGATLLAGGGAPGPVLGLAVGVSAALSTALAMLIGVLLPFVSARRSERPRLIGQPLVGPLVGIISLAVYLSLARAISW